MKKEKKIRNSPEPVNIAGTKAILEQMINCICKIKIREASGTGFFCKIPLGKNESLNVLMTNYHILDEKYYEDNKEIHLLLNDEKEAFAIDLLTGRKTYFNKEYDIAIIELKEEDGIKNFLELDDNLFKEKEKVFYEGKSIYVLQYPYGRNACVSYGLSINIEKNDIKHTCSTENGSSGSPILTNENDKLKEEMIKKDEKMAEFKEIEKKLNDLTEENKGLIKKNKELVDDNEIMKRIQQEMEAKMEKDKMREPSMASQEYDNEDNEQKLLKLKTEIEKLKIMENNFKGLEKENSKYKE